MVVWRLRQVQVEPEPHGERQWSGGRSPRRLQRGAGRTRRCACAGQRRSEPAPRQRRQLRLNSGLTLGQATSQQCNLKATFWSAKARPSTGTSAGSSRARSCGTCRREVEEATDTAPSDAPGSASRVFSAARTSARHTLRPFTIRATRCTPAAETESCSAFECTPCTRSRCRASMPVPSRPAGSHAENRRGWSPESAGASRRQPGCGRCAQQARQPSRCRHGPRSGPLIQLDHSTPRSASCSST